MLIIRSITIYIHSYIASIRLFIPPFSVLHTPTPKKTLLTLRHFTVCRRRYMCWLLCSTTQHSRSTYIWTNNQRVWWWPAASAFNVITERAEHIYIYRRDWLGYAWRPPPHNHFLLEIPDACPMDIHPQRTFIPIPHIYHTERPWSWHSTSWVLKRGSQVAKLNPEEERRDIQRHDIQHITSPPLNVWKRTRKDTHRS